MEPSSAGAARPPIKPLVTPGGFIGSLFAGALIGLVRALSAHARQSLARGLGRLAFALRIRRRVTLENLRHAFPEKSEAERIDIARGAYCNMALAAFESLTSDQLSDAEVQRALTTDDRWPALEAAIRRGGVLVASAHFGSWELFAEVMARRGIRFSAVVRPLAGAFNERIVRSRIAAGVGLILQRGALKQMISTIRRGETVVQLIDQVLPARHGVFVPFFGRLASTTPALSVAALRTGAPVYLTLAAREAAGLRMFIEGPFALPQTGDREADLKAHVAQLTAVIEHYVRRYPDQWLWLHRRWKVQPPPPP